MSDQERRLLTPEEVEAWMAAQRWTYAKTMPKYPHEYSLRRRQRDLALYERVIATIWLRGYDRPYLARIWRSYDVDDRWYIWICSRPAPGPPPLDEVLINRARRVQDALL